MSALPLSTAHPAAAADPTATLFARLRADVAFFAVRLVEEDSETVSVRKGVPQPFTRSIDRGAMVTVIDRGAYGYAATSDISVEGLQAALDHAIAWADATRNTSVMQYPMPAGAAPRGLYASQIGRPLPSRRELFAIVAQVDADAQVDPRVVDSYASVERCIASHRYLTSHGGDVTQIHHFVLPNMRVTASDGTDTQTRSLGGQYNGFCQQGGSEVLERSGFVTSGARLAREALALLEAPNCPSGRMDLLLMPDQMMLQIHESIGHPLELDRILGDERNFAGTSFVTLDMFGHYQYGSPLLNVSFDPTRSQQFASYAFDDEGSTAQRELLIREGLLLKPLGGALSQARANHLLGEHVDIGGVATTRSSSWNRAPIDRMANLNIEAGTSRLDEMIAAIDRGIMMKTNVSWSIDDSRNKFQFGCEWGQLIENGKLTTIVKNPNYRGVSATFWRSLNAVGDDSTLEVMGTPFCGKGEPSQVIRVGHASPACLFTDVDVFGAGGAA
ncbi:MAG: TldD/PmbA family protein [Burkholderiaceae bacterium]